MTTIKDVARLAGVSPSTVSRVLGGKNVVNEATRRMVLEAVEQTGYVPNPLAQSLKMGSSDTIALMVPSIENPTVPIITRGVEDVARKNGFSVVLCNTDEDQQVERAFIDKMKLRWVAGFLVCTAVPGADYIARLRQENFPVVLANRFNQGDEAHMDTVAVDNYQIGYDAAAYLIRCGCRRIAIARGNMDIRLYAERDAGCRAALADAGLPFEERLVLPPGSNESYYAAARALCQGPDRPDGIFATSDPKALVILHALHDMHLRIPEDCAVIGVDNVSFSAMAEPPLTTIAQPLYEIGAAAARKLIAQIRYKGKYGVLPPPSTEVLPHDLIVRRSTP